MKEVMNEGLKGDEINEGMRRGEREEKREGGG